MKLPANNANHIKVPLSCLKITDNVRMNFDEAEIEELANSIRQNGLMNPITVRPPETDADGNKTYEVIAGGRRIRAHQWLCEHGDDFSLIECCIRTGDKWALQMIENIQRTDLTPREKENAVAKALEEGLTQTQIADKLSKPIQWVSDIVAGAKIRKIADAAGLNTEEITTKTLSQLRSIPAEKLQNCLKELIAEGGTYRVATRMMQAEKNPATTHVSTPDEDFISDEESIISPSEMSEEDFYDDEENNRPRDWEELSETEPQQAHKESDSIRAAKELRQPFNWYLRPSDPNAMSSILGRLPFYMKKMALDTKIYIQAGNHTATIQSVIYEPENSRLIFRAFDNEFNEELKSK